MEGAGDGEDAPVEAQDGELGGADDAEVDDGGDVDQLEVEPVGGRVGVGRVGVGGEPVGVWVDDGGCWVSRGPPRVSTWYI